MVPGDASPPGGQHCGAGPGGLPAAPLRLPGHGGRPYRRPHRDHLRPRPAHRHGHDARRCAEGARRLARGGAAGRRPAADQGHRPGRDFVAGQGGGRPSGSAGRLARDAGTSAPAAFRPRYQRRAGRAGRLRRRGRPRDARPDGRWARHGPLGDGAVGGCWPGGGRGGRSAAAGVPGNLRCARPGPAGAACLRLAAAGRVGRGRRGGPAGAAQRGYRGGCHRPGDGGVGWREAPRRW